MKTIFNKLKIFHFYAYEVKRSITLKKFKFEILKYSPHFFYYSFKNYNTLDLQMPWITFKAYNFLKKLNMNGFTIFEYGSGGSSLFFASKCKEVYSVEHDKDWYQRLNSRLITLDTKFKNLAIKLIEPEKGNGSGIVSETNNQYKGYHFKNYSEAISDYPDEFFDLVFIDGRVRPYCLTNSISKVKKGGYLVFDNANRSHYRDSLSKIEAWKIMDSYGPTICDLGFSQTNIYRKPI